MCADELREGKRHAHCQVVSGNMPWGLDLGLSLLAVAPRCGSDRECMVAAAIGFGLRLRIVGGVIWLAQVLGACS